jgi:phosphoribosylcarboxyaminoimidazole (NCAIR) mutase
MRRREFVALAGATACALPTRVWAQALLPVVGLLRRNDARQA